MSIWHVSGFSGLLLITFLLAWGVLSRVVGYGQDKRRRLLYAGAFSLLVAGAVASVLYLLVPQIAGRRPADLSVPLPPVEIVSPKHTTTAIHDTAKDGDRWNLTERVNISGGQLDELYRSVVEVVRDQPRLAQLITDEVRLHSWSAHSDHIGRITVSIFPYDRSHYLLLDQYNLDRLEDLPYTYSGWSMEELALLRRFLDKITGSGWSMRWSTRDELVLSPNLSAWTNRRQVDEFVKAEFSKRGWKVFERGPGLEFHRKSTWDVPSRWYHVTVTRSLPTSFPFTVHMPGIRTVTFEAGGGSQLIIDAPDHIVSSTSPSGERQVGAGRAMVFIDLSLPQEVGAVRVKMLGRRFRNDVGERIAWFNIWKAIISIVGLYWGGSVLAHFVGWATKRLPWRKRKPSSLGD